MKATVDKDACIGCGLCESICPGVFKMGGDNLAEVIADPVPADLEASAQEAADGCPVTAIALE